MSVSIGWRELEYRMAIRLNNLLQCAIDTGNKARAADIVVAANQSLPLHHVATINERAYEAFGLRY